MASWVEGLVIWFVISAFTMFFYMIAKGLERADAELGVLDAIFLILCAPVTVPTTIVMLIALALSVWWEDKG